MEPCLRAFAVVMVFVPAGLLGAFAKYAGFVAFRT